MLKNANLFLSHNLYEEKLNTLDTNFCYREPVFFALFIHLITILERRRLTWYFDI